jgi:hypothetical protein
MDTNTILIIILGANLVVVVLVAGQWKSLRRLLNFTRQWPALENTFIAESLVDLKSGFRLITSLFSLILAALTFLGATRLAKMQDDLTQYAQKRIDSRIDSLLSTNIDTLRRKIADINAIYHSTEAQSRSFEKFLSENTGKISKYTSTLEKASRRMRSYVVHPPLPPQWGPPISHSTFRPAPYFFRDLQTVQGEKLPETFDEVPIVVFQINPCGLGLLDIRRDHFVVASENPSKPDCYFTILIMTK